MVVYLLTDSGGRQSYMVQGVRSARGHGSKLALFQPMFAVEFEGLESSRMQMHRFREVRSGIVLQSLPFDVRKSTIALFMAEVLYRLVKECEPNQRLFDFVWGSVAALDALDADDWTPGAIDAALEALPEQLDVKKRLVFQAVRVAVCGNLVSPPLGETMALVGRADCLPRIERARSLAG